MKLSETMTNVLEVMKQHGSLKRYVGGFWSWEDVEILQRKNGPDIYECPIWWCDVKTLRALEKRNLVILDETKKECHLVS